MNDIHPFFTFLPQLDQFNDENIIQRIKWMIENTPVITTTISIVIY